jgi:hypothetical protein
MHGNLGTTVRRCCWRRPIRESATRRAVISSIAAHLGGALGQVEFDIDNRARQSAGFRCAEGRPSLRPNRPLGSRHAARELQL